MKFLGHARISLLGVSAVGLLNVGCGRQQDPGASQVAVAPLNSAPKTSDFVVQAQNSVRLQAGSIVNGGDIGALGTGSGPFLSGGVAIDLLTGAKTESSHNLIAESIRLGTGVTVGDVQTNRLVKGTGVHLGAVSGMVALPAIPSASAVSPGSTNLAVATGATASAVAGPYATVSVGTGGTLRLAAGSYDMTNLVLGTGARLEALAAVQIHIANRLSAASGSFIGGASGPTLTARNLRIEISGRNGTSGALGATPPAASIGTGAKVTALVLVPNGTLVIATGAIATGAFVGRDVDAGGAGTNLVFQDGFPSCTASTCDDGNPCTVDVCGPSGICSHSSAPAGTACGDGNACNGTEACNGQGTCQPGTPVACAASDQCHEAGTCDSATGACTNPAKADGSACNDSNACTQIDTCQAGACVGANPVVCAASDQCHTTGTCNPATGACTAPAKPDGTACSDADACTQTDSCQAGVCPGSNPITCAALDQCHVAGVCDPANGTCSNPAAPDGNACNDGNACTRTDTCQASVCAGSNPVVCATLDQCHVAGVCDPTNGTCSNPVAPDGSACNDGNACTRTDACQAGLCTGSNPVVCAALDQCHLAGTCNPADGTCSNAPSADGFVSVSAGGNHACGLRSDGTIVCWGGNADGQLNPPAGTFLAVSGGSGDTCGVHTDGTVVCWGYNEYGQTNAPTGTFLSVSAGNLSSCGVRTDGTIACWGDDYWRQATPPTGTFRSVSAGSGHACGLRTDGTVACWGYNEYGQATPPTGAFLSVTASAVHSCGVRMDGIAACWGDNRWGQAIPPSTETFQSLSAGGSHTCGVRTDGTVACWGYNEYGQVTPPAGTFQSVSAGNHQTCGLRTDGTIACWGRNDEGQASPPTGTPSNAAKANGTPCDDGNACTQIDTCQVGACVGANPVVCAASDQCHATGTCDPATGACTDPVAPDGSVCSDGNACTQTDTCQAGVCVGANPVVCTASDQCHTTGTCDPATGACSNPVAPDGNACNDGNACTRTDTCQSGVCTGSNSITCAAVDQCHVAGVCDPANGTCSNPAAADGSACNDGNPGTRNDTCQAGVCTGVSSQPEVIATVSVGGHPGAIGLNPNTKRLYVGQDPAASVAVVDMVTNTMLTSIPTAGYQNVGIAANPTTGRIYITQGFANRVLVVDGNTNAVLNDVPVPSGDTIAGIVVNPETNRVYVARNNPGGIIVMDGTTNVCGPVIDLGVGLSSNSSVAMAIALTDNKMYIADAPRNRVVVINTADNTVKGYIPVQSTPIGLAVNPTTRRVYVANMVSHTLSIIDINTDTVVETIPAGAGAAGVAINPRTNRIYVTQYPSANGVSVIDGNSNTILATVPVGWNPLGVAIDPTSDLIYVANNNDSTISVIRDPR